MTVLERITCPERYYQNTDYAIPEWARAEHMDMSVPQTALWLFS